MVIVAAAVSVCAGPGARVGTALGGIAQTAPSATSSPIIAGSPAAGQTLSVATGSWAGDAPIAFTFQWQLCDSSAANCAPIAGASGQSYTIAAADVGSTLVVGVTAVNDAGTGVAVSAPSSVVTLALAPVATSQPSIVGPPLSGSTLTATGGAWNGDPPLVFGYQWQRCVAASELCAAIAGATGQTYTPGAADVGFRLRVLVSATNASGAGQSSSVLSGIIGGPPAEVAPPTLAGSAEVGQTLSAQPGRWAGPGPLAYAYQWQRCSRAGAGCAAVPGATASSYTASAGDVGSVLRVLVTASNPIGSVAAASAATVAVAAAPASPGRGALAGDPYRAGTIGYDASFPDCRRRPPAGGFVIVGVNDGRPFTRNPCFRLEDGWATNRGAPFGIYLNTAYSTALLGSITPGCAQESAEQDLSATLATAYALGCSEASASLDGLPATSPPSAIWLDVETSNPWSRRRPLNAATIEGMLDAVSAIKPQAIVGIYSDPHWWQEITGGMISATTPEWIPGGVSRVGCPPAFAGGPVWISQGGGARLDVDRAC